MRDEIPEIMGHVIDEHGQKRELRRGPVQHASLSPDQLGRIGRLRDVLIEARPMTLDGWVDGFLRDVDPESEIRLIEACAVVYRRLTEKATLTPEEKKRLYSMLCGISMGQEGPGLAAGLPAGKGLPGIDRIVRMYREALQ